MEAHTSLQRLDPVTTQPTCGMFVLVQAGARRGREQWKSRTEGVGGVFGQERVEQEANQAQEEDGISDCSAC